MKLPFEVLMVYDILKLKEFLFGDLEYLEIN